MACGSCQIYLDRAADCARKLEEQETRFQKAKADFEARAAQILATQAQQTRTITQLQEDGRRAREERDTAISAVTGGRRYFDGDEETATLRTEVERLRRELLTATNKLDTAKLEVDKLKGKPAESGYNEKDPLGTIGRLLNLEID